MGSGGVWVSLLVETLLSFFFILVFLRLKDREDKISASLLAGTALFAATLFGQGITGASLNPAKSAALALFVGGAPLRDLWIFVVAPIAGGLLAALVDLYLERGKKAASRPQKEI